MHICLSGKESSQAQEDFSSHKEIILNQEKELETVRSECDLLNSELRLRKELTSDLEVQIQNLEKKVQASEEAALDAAHQLSTTVDATKSLSDKVEERNSFSVAALMK